MLLVLGDSFAARLERQLDPAWPVACAGCPGAKINSGAFRRWAIRTAHECRPQRVLLMVGSNDLATPQFRQRELMDNFEELSLGLLAAGVDSVYICAIPPRCRFRSEDASAGCYRRRRQLANVKLRHKCRREPICFISCSSDQMIGRDGVHPSQQGWVAICHMVRFLL